MTTNKEKLQEELEGRLQEVARKAGWIDENVPMNELPQEVQDKIAETFPQVAMDFLIENSNSKNQQQT